MQLHDQGQRRLLSEREEKILDAVIRTYVETAEPAGSRTVAKRFGLNVSAATVRNAMADLEEKGFLFHPHTSAGRVPTDLAYRYYVNTLMQPVRIAAADQRRLRRELTEDRGALDRLIQRAVQALGLVTGELGVAISPKLDEVVLEKLELVSLSTEKVLLVLTLKNGLVRTVYVDLPSSVPPEALISLTMILNERLAGQTLASIRLSLQDRLRDASADEETAQLLNIFMQSAEELLDRSDGNGESVMLGRTSVIANQPEFADENRLKRLIELTEERELLSRVLQLRSHADTPTITIGVEHQLPQLAPFTLVTSEYKLGNVSGVIGVIGPTRMPYEKVASIVEYTSRLLNDLTTPPARRDPKLH